MIVPIWIWIAGIIAALGVTATVATVTIQNNRLERGNRATVPAVTNTVNSTSAPSTTTGTNTTRSSQTHNSTGTPTPSPTTNTSVPTPSYNTSDVPWGQGPSDQ